MPVEVNYIQTSRVGVSCNQRGMHHSTTLHSQPSSYTDRKGLSASSYIFCNDLGTGNNSLVLFKSNCVINNGNSNVIHKLSLFCEPSIPFTWASKAREDPGPQSSSNKLKSQQHDYHLIPQQVSLQMSQQQRLHNRACN